MSLAQHSEPATYKTYEKLQFAYSWILAFFMALLVLHVFIGYIIAPVLFKHFDKKLAGEIMGHIFDYYYPVQLQILFFIWVLAAKYRSGYVSIMPTVKIALILRRILLITSGIMSLTVIQMFLQSQMQIIKLADDSHSLALGLSFGLLHGVSQILYLGQTSLIIWVLCLLYKNYSKYY